MSADVNVPVSSTRRRKDATGPAPAGAENSEVGAVVPRRDWSWRHGPIIGPVNAATGLASLAMIGDLAAVSPGWGAAAGVAAAAGVSIRAATHQISPLGLAYRATCWVGAGGWMTWALATSAWSPNVLAAVAGGALVAGLAAPEMNDHEARVSGRRRSARDAQAAREQLEAAAAYRVKIATEWETRLARVCGVKGALIEAVQQWPNGGGFTLQLRLPPGGTTWQTIAGYMDGLATDADLPLGCGVEVSPGASRGLALLKVSTVDTTAVAMDYPSDYSPLTFTGPLPIGMHRASVLAEVTIQEDAVLVVGRRGSGKTVTLQTFNANLVRCPDALIWHIDLNGSGMSRPWLGEWLAGNAHRPVIDWVAPTPEEAVLMVEVAIDMAMGRKGAYAALMAAVNDDKIPVSASVPAIVIVLDEGAEAVAANRGNAALATALEKLISIGRAARVGLILSGLRPTSETIPTPLKKQVGIKIQMRPEEIAEVAQLFDASNYKGISIEDAPYAGSGLLRTPDNRAITPYRGYDLRPSQIREIAAACVQRRPVLDALTARFGGPAYARRWDRYLTWHTTEAGGTMPTPSTPNDPTDSPEPAAGTGNSSGKDAGQGIAGLSGAAGNLEASLERLRKIRADAEAGNQPSTNDDVDAVFAAIISGQEWDSDDAGGGGDEDQDEAAAADPEGPVQMMVILRAAGPEGLHWKNLLAQLEAAGHKNSRSTVYRWLQAAGPAVTRVGDARDGRWAATPSNDSQ